MIRDRETEIEMVAEAMAAYENRDRYVLENSWQSTGVEPYEACADDFRDLATIAVNVIRGKP